MYRVNKTKKGTLRVNNEQEGESIETKVRRVMQQGAPIEDGAPIIYQERNEGVAPEYDIRSDRFEMAINEIDKSVKAHIAKRESRAAEPSGETAGEIAPTDVQG